jgi:hypothetical protein
MAVKIDELNAAERHLIACALAGEPADFSKSPSSDRAIRADILRRLLLGLDFPALEASSITSETKPGLKVRSIYAKAIVVRGKLDLLEAIRADGNSLPPLILEDAILETGASDEENLDARHARLARLALKNCAFTRVVLTDAKVGGDIELSGARAIHGSDVCEIRAERCQVEGSLTVDGAKLAVAKSAEARKAIIDYALNLTNARIDGDVSLQNGFHADGGVLLDLARVSGSVWIDGSTLSKWPIETDEEGYALHAHNCRIDGSLCMSASKNEAGAVERFRANGCISIRGARIEGNLDCRGAFLKDRPDDDEASAEASAKMEKEWSFSLDARDALIGGDVLFRVSRYSKDTRPLPFIATNLVCLSGARIGGELNCRGSRFLREFDFDNTDIGTNVCLGRKSDKNDRRYEFRSEHKVTLRNARIKGRFECTNAVLTAKPEIQDWNRMDASEFRVDGNLVFSPQLHGDATFERSRVGGDLDLGGLEFVLNDPRGSCLSFSDSIVDRRIAVNPPIKITTKGDARPHIKLDGVEAGILADDGGLGWGPDVRLTLDGLTYKHLEQANQKAEQRLSFWRWFFGKFHLQISEMRKNWLNLQYERERRSLLGRWWRKQEYRRIINRETYRAQPYEHLAKVLDEQGWNEDSRHVLMLKLKLDGMWVPGGLLPLHWLFGRLFGYGLAHRKSLVVLLVYLFIGGFVFHFAARQHLLVVDQSPVTMAFANKQPASKKVDGVLTGDQSSFATPNELLDASDIECGATISPWIYALDSAIPLLDLREHSRCTIKSPPKTTPKPDFLNSMEIRFRYFKAVYTVLGWIITSIVVLTLTGVLRRTAEQ